MANKVMGWSQEEKDKFLLRDNIINQNGEHDKNILKTFNADLLEEIGMNQSKIAALFKEEVKGEEEFTSEILEENNYIVFVFDNTLDWQVIEAQFELESVKALDSKEGYKRAGIGRVLNGKKLLKLINQDENSNTKLPEGEPVSDMGIS